MTARRPPLLPLAGFGLLAAGVYAASAAIVHSPLFAEAPELGAAAVTFDLVAGVPFLFWLLVIRRTRLPWISIVPCVLLSLLAASLVLPRERQHYLAKAQMLVAPAELALMGWAGARVYRLLRRAPAGRDVLAEMRAVTREVIPVRPVADAVAGEVALAWYAFVAWRARPEVAPGETAFTVHRKSGVGGLAGAMAFACAGEMVGVHLLVERWSPPAAWALTALGAYSVVWLIGLARSVALRPTVLADDGVRVRAGALWEIEIPFGRIASVSPVTAATAPTRAPGLLRAALFAQPRLMIELSEPMEAVGLYGRRKRGITRVALYVDQPDELAAELRARMAVPTA